MALGAGFVAAFENARRQYEVFVALVETELVGEEPRDPGRVVQPCLVDDGVAALEAQQTSAACVLLDGTR